MDNAWWDLLRAILPFVILIAFWIFLMRQVGGGLWRKAPNPLEEKLDRILEELTRLRQLLEDREGR